MKRVIVFLALSAIGLFSLSCEQVGVIVPFSYPHPEGGRWVYGRDVTTTAYQDIEYFQINGTYNHPTAGTVQRLDEYNYDPNTQEWVYINTYYLLVTSNEVRYYYDDTNNHDIPLKLPPSINQEWNFSSYDTYYTAKVIAQENVTVPAGSFNNCYKVQYSHQGSAYLNVWFANGIGGIYGVQVEWIGDVTWTLSSYNLPS